MAEKTKMVSTDFHSRTKSVNKAIIASCRWVRWKREDGSNCPPLWKSIKRGRAESAGINRHKVGDERALHRRRSCSIMAPSHVRVAARLHVKQLTGENVGQPLSSEITSSGMPTTWSEGEGNTGGRR
jgi:hypothetical protein